MPEETTTNGAGENGIRRAPQKKTSAADRAVLLEILKRDDVKVDGKISVLLVSKMTGLTEQQIYTYLRKDKYLRAQLADVMPEKLEPTEVEIMDSKPPPTLPLGMVQFTEKEAGELLALRKQDLKTLAKDWTALGMSHEQGERWEKYCRLGSAPTYAVLRGVGGQLVENLTDLQEIIRSDVERVLKKEMPTGTDKEGEPIDPHQVENDIRYRIFAGMNLQLAMFTHLHKAQSLMAGVADKLQRMNGGKGEEKKGEYEPRKNK